MNCKLLIKSHDHSTATIIADRDVLQKISNRFTFRPEGYQFMPAYQAGIWNGETRLISIVTGDFPRGLVPVVLDAAIEMGIDATIDENDFGSYQLKHEMVDYHTLNLDFTPTDYQINAVEMILCKKRRVIISPTGSGKSLILYMLARSLPDDDILFIVPNISLVHQLYTDFEDYSKNDPHWDVEDNCQRISEGATKVVSKRIIISTWQSLIQIKQGAWFKRFNSVFVDEAHLAKAKSITSILNKCKNAEIRAGVTGTLDGCKINELVLVGLFGPVYRVASTAGLIEEGRLSQLQINAITLKYENNAMRDLGLLNYDEEINFIVKNERRNKFIRNLVGQCEGNSLILFQFVEKQGKPLLKLIQDEFPDRPVYFVYGKVSGEEREDIREKVETQDNAIILASYATYSTGINIKNLHNIIFASPSKGQVRVFQSIGRGLRLHASKEECNVYDISDDIRGYRRALNHTMRHLEIRLDSYDREGFNVKRVTLNI